MFYEYHVRANRYITVGTCRYHVPCSHSETLSLRPSDEFLGHACSLMLVVFLYLYTSLRAKILPHSLRHVSENTPARRVGQYFHLCLA